MKKYSCKKCAENKIKYRTPSNFIGRIHRRLKKKK